MRRSALSLSVVEEGLHLLGRLRPRDEAHHDDERRRDEEGPHGEVEERILNAKERIHPKRAGDALTAEGEKQHGRGDAAHEPDERARAVRATPENAEEEKR